MNDSACHKKHGFCGGNAFRDKLDAFCSQNAFSVIDKMKGFVVVQMCWFSSALLGLTVLDCVWLAQLC